MKTVTVILLCLLAFLVLLFVVPIRIICKIQTAGKVDFALAVQVLFVRIPILPIKKRLPNIKKFRRDALERLYEKKRKKEAAAAQKDLNLVKKNIFIQEKYKDKDLWAPDTFDAYRWLLAENIMKLEALLK